MREAEGVVAAASPESQNLRMEIAFSGSKNAKFSPRGPTMVGRAGSTAVSGGFIVITPQHPQEQIRQ
jgi:hypothetical protein